MSSVKEDTLKSVKWTAIEKVSVQGIQFVLGLIMARLLTPEDYGTVGMLAIFIAVSQTFIDSGFSNALIRKLDRTEDDYCTAFYFNIFIAIVCYVGLFISAPWISLFFKAPILKAILRVQSISLIINSIMGVQVAKLTADLDFKALAKRNVVSSLSSGIIGVILAYAGFGVWALVAQTLVQNIINLVIISTYCMWIPRRPFSRDSFSYLWGYGSKMLASGLLNTIYGNLTPIIIGRFFSAKDLGVYSRGTHLAQYPSQITNDVLGRVTFPILSKLQDDEERLISVYRKYICVTSLIIFFGCSLLCAVGRPLVLVLLTSKWEECIIYLQIYCFSIMFDHICRINLNLLQVKGRSDLFFRLEVIKKAIALAILFASIPFGVIGICISKVVYSQIAVFINTYYTGKLFDLGYLKQVKDFSIYFVLSVVCVIPAFLLTFTCMPNVFVLLLGAAISVTLYSVILFKLHDEHFMEVLGTIKQKMGLSR